MNKATFTNFRSFVFAQDDNRDIVHDQGWCGCAVGDFARFIEHSEPHVLASDDLIHSDVGKAVVELLNVHGQIECADIDTELFAWIIRDEGPFPPIGDFEYPVINTYAGLKDLITTIEEFYQ